MHKERRQLPPNIDSLALYKNVLSVKISDNKMHFTVEKRKECN